MRFRLTDFKFKIAVHNFKSTEVGVGLISDELTLNLTELACSLEY